MHEPTQRPLRRSCDDEAELIPTMVGEARLSMHERTVTKAERDAWRREDEERERRRIPLGFRA